MSHKITHTLQKYLPSRQNNLITNMSSSLMFVTVASYMKVEGFHTKCYDALYIADHKSNDCFGRVKCFLLIYVANMRILEMDIDTLIPINGNLLSLYLFSFSPFVSVDVFTVYQIIVNVFLI